MADLKPIETRYKGYRFRSRLEARWAVFFDTLGIAWEYEKEGFDLGEAGWYLPDFWLPEQRCWIEVKGSRPSDADNAKCGALALASGFDVFVLIGEVPRVVYDGWGPNEEWPGAANAIEKFFGGEDDAWDCGHEWHECEKCHYVGIRFPESDKRLPCGCDGKDISVTRRLIFAYNEARSARFEHGECGAPNA